MPQDTPCPPDPNWTDARARAALRTLFDTAVAAADPRSVLARHLPPKPTKGRCIVVGGGKSAAVMAAALEDAWPDVALEGTVVTRYGHAVPTHRIEVIEAAHPVPDANSERGAVRLLERVQGLTKDDLVIALMSGGASALLAAPVPGLTLADKQAINRALLACGANITEMNAVRKHLSAIKGGRLAAAAAPARVVTLAISDVPGDDPAVIGSGPTVPDATTFAQARALIARYGINPPPSVAARLARDDDETPKPGRATLPVAVLANGFIRCPYHAWLYREDGTLFAAPHLTDGVDFNAAEFTLYSVGCTEWGGFVFLHQTPDTASPLEAQLGPVPARIANVEKLPA